MSKYLGSLEETPPPLPKDQTLSPMRISALLLAIIYAAELIAMIFIYFIQVPNFIVEALIDGLIMVILIFPALYFLQLKPLMNEIIIRTRAESNLRRTDQLLNQVLELLPVGVWITDTRGKIIHGNLASQTIWGGAKYVGAEGYGEYKGWWMDSGEKIEPDEWAIIRTIKHGETILNEEIEIEGFDGQHKFILNSSIPIFDDEQNIQGGIIVNQDITRQKLYEEQLVKTNELLEMYFLSIDTNIAYLDKDFNFIRVNDTYAESAAKPAEFFVGKNHFELYPHPENQEIFQQVVDTGESFYVLEKPFVNPDTPERGTTYWDWSLHPVRGAKGEIEGLVLSLVDVSERKRAEFLLERQNEELRLMSLAERENREFAEGLVQATNILMSSLDLDQVFAAILEQIRKTIEFQGAGIVLIKGKVLHLASYLGFEAYPEGLQVLKQITSFEEFPVLRQVCSSAQPLSISSNQEYTYMLPAPGLEWINSVIAAPLMIGNDVIGVIGLISERPAAYDQKDINRLMAFTVPAALAIHNAQLFKMEFTARMASETLREAVQSLTQSLDMDHVIETLLCHIKDIIYTDTVEITLFEDNSHIARQVVLGCGEYTEKAASHVFPVGITDLTIQRIISSGKSMILPNTNFDRSSPKNAKNNRIHQWLLIPLKAKEKMIGLVEIGIGSKLPFDSDQVYWVEALVSQAGIAIQNSWLYEQVRSSRERLQALARKLVEIQENERNHISRELHDEAGQNLSSLRLRLGRLEHDPGCSEHISQQVSELKQLTDSILDDLHRLAIDLRPAALDRLGLVAALEQLAQKMASDQPHLRFEAFGIDGERLPIAIETNLYRIAQEALTNAIRHAQATDVSILLERGKGKTRIFIEDNGIGFISEKVPTEGHLGLVGMQERAEMMGGTLTIESAPGMGTSIVVEVPDDNTHLDRR